MSSLISNSRTVKRVRNDNRKRLGDRHSEEFVSLKNFNRDQTGRYVDRIKSDKYRTKEAERSANNRTAKKLAECKTELAIIKS